MPICETCGKNKRETISSIITGEVSCKNCVRKRLKGRGLW